MHTVISAKNLGKKYILRHQSHEAYTALRDVLASKATLWAKRLLNPTSKVDSVTKEEFWALKDASFDIQQGERVGIIGRNGAGKSTLLKLLSRITEPSTGKVNIRGRVASLLEVGTGFHPELTGRENIFLNGAILGMSKIDIKKRFDKIVYFADIEKFLDTPVKRYSSGMYVRLAFAVAAHIEPEILIIDEVLAVGDAQFQKKCLNKMKTVGEDGKTVILVSHNMNVIETFCSKTMLLEDGKIRHFSNDTKAIINKYLSELSDLSFKSSWTNQTNAYDSEYFKPISFSISDESGTPLRMPVGNNSDIFVTIKANIKKYVDGLLIGYEIFSDEGIPIFLTSYSDSKNKTIEIKKGIITLKSKIPKRFLNEGIYRLELLSGIYCQKWFCQPGKDSPAIYLNIQGELSDSSLWIMKREGLLAPVLEWHATY